MESQSLAFTGFKIKAHMHIGNLTGNSLEKSMHSEYYFSGH
jgi:hypothetical protein